MAMSLSTPLVAQNKLKGSDSKQYNLALNSAKGTDNAKAISILRDIYSKNPNNINVAYNLGICYMNMSGNPDSALYYFNIVKRLDQGEWTNSRSELYFAIARTYQLKYQYDEALKTYNIIEENDKEKLWANNIAREREICNNAKILLTMPVKLETKEIEGINSEYNDYRPVISSDAQTLIFTSRRGKGATQFEDGQYEEASYITNFSNGKWSEPKRIEGLFDDKKNQETATCIANNNNELYICRDGVAYVSLKEPSTQLWGKAQEIGEPINEAGSQINYVYVTSSGTEMYFSSNREGGLGGFDIYRSYRLPNGNWGLPRNLGESINTPYDEDSPIMSADGNILYFSSTGHNTMGGYDIYYAVHNIDSTYTAIQNIGYPINTPDDDIYFVPTAQKDTAYYASMKWNKEPAGFDIYQVIYDEPEVNKLALISGYIKSNDMYDINITAESNGEQIGRFAPNRETGKFIIIAKAGEKYNITVLNGDYVLNQEIITTDKDCYLKSGKIITTTDFDFITLAETEEAIAKEENAAKNTIESANDIQSKISEVIENEQNMYTVQFMSLRNTTDINSIDLQTENIAEIKYKDGWVVYVFGAYDSRKEANKAKQQIIKNKQYGDAFVRNIKNYKRFVK